jgi:hypothetical protein
MPAPKRKRPVGKRHPKVKSSKKMYTSVKQAVKKEISMQVETKASCQSSSDCQEIFHNNFITRNTNLLTTSQGTSDNVQNSVLVQLRGSDRGLPLPGEQLCNRSCSNKHTHTTKVPKLLRRPAPLAMHRSWHA